MCVRKVNPLVSTQLCWDLRGMKGRGVEEALGDREEMRGARGGGRPPSSSASTCWQSKALREEVRLIPFFLFLPLPWAWSSVSAYAVPSDGYESGECASVALSLVYSLPWEHSAIPPVSPAVPCQLNVSTLYNRRRLG